MELTTKQKDYINLYINDKVINSENIDRIHKEIYQLMINENIIELKDIENLEFVYNNLVWDYLLYKMLLR